MNREDFLKRVGLDEVHETWVFGDGDDSAFAGSWQDYICYQPSPSLEFLVVCHMAVEQDANAKSGLTMRIVKSDISVDEYIYTDDTIEAAVLEALSSFPEVKVDSNPAFAAACTDSVTKTRRGPPQHNVGNAWYYNGATRFDGPLFVSSAHFDGTIRYAIWKQDNFEDYGFVMV